MNSVMTVTTIIATISPKGLSSGFAFFRRRIELSSLSIKVTSNNNRFRVAVDASLIKADANRQRGVEGSQGLPPEISSRAIDEYLAVLDDAALVALPR